jgi:hypothetical protein
MRRADFRRFTWFPAASIRATIAGEAGACPAVISVATDAGSAEDYFKAGRSQEGAMKALILYVVFVVIGAVIAGGIGLFVERQVSSAASLIVFLILFFTNFAASWIAVILVMDGSLKNAQGRQDQLDTERVGKASMNAASAARAAK